MNLGNQRTYTPKLGVAAWYLKQGLKFEGLEVVDSPYLGKTAVFVFRGEKAMDLEAVGDENKPIELADLEALSLPLLVALAKVTGRVSL